MFPRLPVSLGCVSRLIVHVMLHPVHRPGLLAGETILGCPVVDPSCRRMLHYLTFREISIREQLRHGNRWRIRLLFGALAARLALLLLLLGLLVLGAILQCSRRTVRRSILIYLRFFATLRCACLASTCDTIFYLLTDRKTPLHQIIM